MSVPPHVRHAGALLLAVLWCSGQAWAQTAAGPAEILQTKRATELRDAPAATAGVISSLPASTGLTRQGEQRSGPWVQVRTASGATGWVHLFDLGNPASAASAGSAAGGMASGLLRGVTSLFGKGSSQAPTTVATATVGVRGLDAQDLANAQPDLNAVGQMEAQRADASVARQFASGAALVARQVPALPEPAPAGATGGFSAPGGQ